MNPSDFAEGVIKELAERRDVLSENIAHGNCSDFAEYKGKANRVRAFDEAITIIKDQLERYEKE